MRAAGSPGAAGSAERGSRCLSVSIRVLSPGCLREGLKAAGLNVVCAGRRSGDSQQPLPKQRAWLEVCLLPYACFGGGMRCSLAITNTNTPPGKAGGQRPGRMALLLHPAGGTQRVIVFLPQKNLWDVQRRRAAVPARERGAGVCS